MKESGWCFVLPPALSLCDHASVGRCQLRNRDKQNTHLLDTANKSKIFLATNAIKAHGENSV